MRFAVFGNPVAHSRSPAIHEAFARQFGLTLTYERLLAKPEEFANCVHDFFAAGAKGANVTLPFKEAAFSLCKETSDRARVAGAVNTLWQENGKLCGDNTDGVGLVTDMERNLGWLLAGKSVLILGAGGAVRGILKPLVDAGIGNLVVANRTLARADALARDMQSHNIALETQTLNAITGSYGLVINAISAGLDGDMPPLPPHLLADDACCYDLIYGGAGHLQTPFIRWAEAQGCQHAANGLGMLVEQAAASFYRWLGKQPKTQEVIALLRHDQKSECS